MVHQLVNTTYSDHMIHITDTPQHETVVIDSYSLIAAIWLICSECISSHLAPAVPHEPPAAPLVPPDFWFAQHRTSASIDATAAAQALSPPCRHRQPPRETAPASTMNDATVAAVEYASAGSAAAAVVAVAACAASC